MVMKQCVVCGKPYEVSKYADCPYCSGKIEIGATIPLGSSSAGSATENFSVTQKLSNVNTVSMPTDPGVTRVPDNVPNNQQNTVIFDDNKNSEIMPVRGWLVVIAGEKLGMDFRLHTAINTVGRSKNNDVCFDFDPAVSKENSFTVQYDDRNNLFYIIPGEGSNNIYVNNELLLAARKLKDYDIIEVGKTKLVFRSLCNETFIY